VVLLASLTSTTSPSSHLHESGAAQLSVHVDACKLLLPSDWVCMSPAQLITLTHQQLYACNCDGISVKEY